ncbi:MAG: tetratricopeptide repeat protein [Gammaproteobacteria bacterium]
MTGEKPRRKVYVPAVGPKLRILLVAVLVLFALMSINAIYLASITFLEWLTGHTYQDYFYQYMFLFHLTVGLLLVVPVIVYGAIHFKNAWTRPNRRAVHAGIALLSCAILLIVSGLMLVRFGFFEIKNPNVRQIAYWMHVLIPLLCIWLFVLHRLAGKRIRWRVGLAIGGVAACFALVMVVLQAQDPRQWGREGPKAGLQYFFPSLARTATGKFIPAKALMMDSYCENCHKDTYKEWFHSMHHFSSFNNPAYLFSVRNTRKMALERDGNVKASRWCAGCHDPVPFFSGAFDKPDFDDVHDPTSQAGITCVTCHAITHINSVKGNSDYTIEEPLQYPFAYSHNPFLQWVNHQLVKAKPEMHKKTFLKSFHGSAEFCSTCHKVHLPVALNHYKWLRGQDHYDAWLLSGVSGHGVASFYYPKKAKTNCQSCHMPLMASNDFGARFFDDSGKLKVHDHQFMSANTAIPALKKMPAWVNDKQRDFLDGVMRVDIFGIRDGGQIDGQLHAPLRPELPVLSPGQQYLLETVIRTMTMGHVFTQGTADSNEIWMDVTVRDGDRVIGRSGAMRDGDGRVDPWSHFVNAWVLDRDGHKIDRRNPEDIFTMLYNHQIPPGAADVIHYRLRVPRDVHGPITVNVKLQYRKFDTTYMKDFQGKAFKTNDLPVTTLAEDSITLPVAGVAEEVPPQKSDIIPWQRWNDYGIGLMRKPQNRQLRQAEEAFRQVGELGRADGPLNLARAFLREGRLDEAAEELQKAAHHNPPPVYPWSVAWFSGLVNKQLGNFDAAIEDFKALANTQFQDARDRNFDFSRDYRLLDQLGETRYEQARQLRGPSRRKQRMARLKQAAHWFEAALVQDPENVAAHFNLSQIYADLGDAKKAALHQRLHARYKPDDNAGDRAVNLQRQRNAAADHAAEPVVIYDLQRPGTYGLPSSRLAAN